MTAIVRTLIASVDKCSGSTFGNQGRPYLCYGGTSSHGKTYHVTWGVIKRGREVRPREAKEGPYQDRPLLCPFRLLPLLTCSGSAITFLKIRGPKSKYI